MWTRRQFIKGIGAVPLAGVVGTLSLPSPESSPGSLPGGADSVRYSDGGKTSFGDWWADVRFGPTEWVPGVRLDFEVFLHLSPAMVEAFAAGGYPLDGLLMLVTSERCFDPDGWLRMPGDERMSTLITPTGLAIEGGSVGQAISRTTGYRHRNPVDQFKRLAASEIRQSDHSRWGRFAFQVPLPADTPPGVYRLRFDFGIYSKRRNYSLNAEGFAYRPRDPKADRSTLYSQPIPCSGTDVQGRQIDATRLRRRIYWVILSQYNSNGYFGVVADEDRGHFALSDRNIIPDDVILPLSTYNLEPEIKQDVVDPQRNIPWDYASGELSIKVTDPTGKTVDLGAAPFTGERNGRPTTGDRRFTAWKAPMYGRYTVEARGWIADRWGNRYEGGGTYRFWIAKRLTMATATFQGQSYPVGATYGRDMAFNPPVPADVTVTAELYPYSDPARRKSLTYTGRASSGGVFGALQGMKPFPLDEPGEYHAVVLATYTDGEKALWVSSMRHAGVVYPPDSPLIAHGKKLRIRGTNQLVDRGESRFEGYVEPNDGFRNLDHIDFPYNAGDVLLIASDGNGANKIEPVLTYEVRGSGQGYDPRIQPIGQTNVRIETSNGMSPHLYPEYITDWAYYYAAGPRPGFMSRFLVGEDGVRAPYWPTSATSFGGQIGASNNGDIPGTIYRLIGGVVLRRKGEPPMYAGYTASAFIIPKGANNNRVIAPGSEDLLGPDGTKHRVFLVSLRPGMVYEAGATTMFGPAFQIDPILPVNIRCALWRYGEKSPTEGEGQAEGDRPWEWEKLKEWEGRGIAGGSWAPVDRVALERPGLYRYTVESDWEDHPCRVPGLPEEGGHVYVVERERPAGAVGLRLGLKSQRSFKLDEGLLIEGTSTGERVYYAMITPGCVVEQGELPVEEGRFRYRFDPAAVNARVPIYDIRNVRNGRLETGRVIHLTLFSREKAADGTPYHCFQRVVLRGTTALLTS